MKKLTTIFAALALLISTSAFANIADKVTREVQAALLKNFETASNVTWEVMDDFYFATFDLNHKTVTAAYSEKGELLGLSRKLLLSECPLNVAQALKSKYAGYAISNTVSEIVYEGQTFYYAAAAGATKILTLKCFPDGQIIVEKRTKK